MKSPQFLLGCAVVGFILSFLAGLIASVGLGTILVRSFIFAVVAVFAGFGLRFVATKFLLPAQDTLVDGATPEQAGTSVGEVVDITVDDDELPDDNSSTKFIFQKPVFAGQEKTDTVQQKEQDESVMVSESTASTEGFAPVSPEVLTGSAVEGVSSSVSAGSQEVEPLQSASEGSTDVEELEELEELPDIGMAASEEEGSESLENSVDSDSPSVSSGRSNGSASAAPTGDSNSAEIAKAIRTVLLRDDS